MSETQPSTTEIWGEEIDTELDTISDQTSLNLAPPNLTPAYLDLNMGMIMEESFHVGDFLVTPSFDEYPSSMPQSVFDPALWASTPAPPLSTCTNNRTSTDYFALESELDRVVAPSDLLTAPTSIAIGKPQEAALPPTLPEQVQEHIETAPSTSPVKTPKKRGRKRKQLDADAQVVERKKFLERNRIAANRCRERKKTYVSNLESRSKELQTQNAFLGAELERLREEVVALRLLAGVNCGCDDGLLAANLRKRLSADERLDSDGVEEVVNSFLRLRSQGGIIPTSTWEGMGMESPASAGSSSRSESVMNDDVFSPTGVGKMEDSGHGSEQSSPAEDGEGEKLNHLALEKDVRLRLVDWG